MSTLYSNPSPSKAGMSTKRPYESTTPSNLGTPRDTSNQGSGRSPGPNKKARSNGEEGREVGKGGQWMIAQLDELQRMYKEVLLAATAVIQYQTYALRLGHKSRTLPVHLQRRVKISWGNFEATRRHVQAYMNEAAADASTPSSKQLPIPVPLPSSTSLQIPSNDPLPPTAPIASPIPLSASTMLSFPQPSTGTGDGIIKSEPKNEFEFNILPTLPSNNGLGELDLANMNMSDFAALMAGNGFDYPPIQQQHNISTQATSVVQPNTTTTLRPMQIPIPVNPVPGINREQSDTDRLLAQLGAFTGPDTTINTSIQTQGTMGTNSNQAQSQAQQAGIDAVNDDEVNALLASLNDGNVGTTDYSSFDFGDIDLGNLGDMSGLFNTSTLPTMPNLPVDNSQSSNTLSNTNANTVAPTAQSMPIPSQQQTQPAVQEQVSQALPIPEIKQESANINPASVAPVVGVDPNLDLTNVFDESQAIDLDDFNFGDGDGGEEGGIDLTGDEFENLLAAFN